MINPLIWPSLQQPLKPYRVLPCEREIGPRQARPLLRRARMGVGQVCDRQTRAQHGPADPIEEKEAAGWIVVQQNRKPPSKRLADPSCPQPLAFEVQEGQFV